MKLRLSIIAMLMAMPATAWAKNPVFVTTKVIADRPTVTADPSMGYVLLRSEIATPVHLMRVASPEDETVYAGMRQAALEKEKKKFPGRLAAYQSQLRLYEAMKKNGTPSAKPSAAPVEPTDANFQFTPFNLLAGATLGPMDRFAKGENGESTYLQAITPGSYRIYGLVMVVPNGAAGGTCFCMGSVKFTVRAGEVTDMGQLRRGSAASSSLLTVLVPAASDMTIDSRIKDWKIVPADYRAVGKLPNYYGITLSRIASMAGVIGYDRDKIVDLALAQAPRAAAGQ